jgi:hypothetical protein
MNKNKQKTLDKVKKLLNDAKEIFGDNIEHLQIERLHSNIYNVKAIFEIWKKIEGQNGVIYCDYFFVEKNKTYEEATNNYISYKENI